MAVLLSCFDTETTGLDVRSEHVVQMSCVTYFPGASNTVVTFNQLANPGKPVGKAGAIHGLQDEALKQAMPSGVVVKAWWRALQDYQQRTGSPMVLAGHNVLNYDIPLLQKYLPVGWPALPVIDTMVIARRLFPAAPNHRLSSLVGEFHQLDPALAQHAHDGLADCYMVAKLVDHYMSVTGMDLFRLADWCAQPQMLGTVPFGRHKGRPFSMVPSGQLWWFVRQPDMDRDVLFTAKQLLGLPT
jgi:DNA polymerase III epsilon subunit-like protein